MAMNPAGQDPATRPSGLVESSHTPALLPPKSQSFLDHLIAGFWPTGSSNNPDAAEQSANTAPSPAHAPRGAFLRVRRGHARCRSILMDRCEATRCATRLGLI